MSTTTAIAVPSASPSAAATQSIDPNSPLAGYPRDNLKHVVITATCFAFILSTFSVGFRLISRKLNGKGLYLDDFFIVGALLFEYGISIAGVVLLYHGLGQHIYYVSPEDLIIYNKTLFTGSFLYTGCIVCIKLSILALYRRLFPTKLMLALVYTVGLLVILWGFGVCLVGGLVCIPVRKLWDPTVVGGCLDLAKFYYGLQIPNILTDAIILIMPIKVVWGLPISKTQKSLLSGIFVVGILTFVFDVVRLVALIELSKSGADATYNEVQSSVWTCIEPAVGITAACLSNMRPLFKVAHDKVWVGLTSTFTGKGSQNSQRSLRNKNSDISNSSEHSGESNGSSVENNTVSGDEEKQNGNKAVSPQMVA